jgi:hypothetical protein
MIYLAGDNGLHEEAEHAEHGQATVLDLLDLELSKGIWVIGQAQGVEVVATRVEFVQTLSCISHGRQVTIPSHTSSS